VAYEVDRGRHPGERTAGTVVSCIMIDDAHQTPQTAVSPVA
jgi:hypothetical protein